VPTIKKYLHIYLKNNNMDEEEVVGGPTEEELSAFVGDQHHGLNSTDFQTKNVEDEDDVNDDVELFAPVATVAPRLAREQTEALEALLLLLPEALKQPQA
tara:strand:+ start:198 stop:497 length:300 start_codon:yes stop_codon:yes gene_type:complete